MPANSSTPFPFRALSPCHPTALDRDYLLRTVEACGKYGFNAIQICGDTHGAEGNLDGFTEFQKYPKANQGREAHRVEVTREILREACEAAHAQNIEVYYWHHEFWYPEALPEVYPDWFEPAPQNRFTRDLRGSHGLVPKVAPDAPIWDFIDAKFDEAFQQLPELDGTIMTIQESMVPIYCLSEDFEEQVEMLVGLYQRLKEAHDRVGKKWLLRTFAWREHEYKVVKEAVYRFKSPVPVESKGVPMDWSLFYPYDPLLAEFDGMTKHTELAPSCEFHGTTYHPVGHPWLYTGNLAYAAERGHTGAVLRIDRAGHSMLGGPDEGVLACVGKWLAEPGGRDVGDDYLDWSMERYGIDRKAAFRFLNEVMEGCWNATIRCYHNEKIYMGDSFSLGYDRNFFIAERHLAIDYESDDPLVEKREAIEYVRAASVALGSLRGAFSSEDYDDLQKRIRFLELTCHTFHRLGVALVARHNQMYSPSATNLQALVKATDDLEAAGAATSREYPELNELGSRSGQRQAGCKVEAFARAVRADIPNLPKRRVVQTMAANDLGAATTYRDREAHQPGPENQALELLGNTGARHVLVLFAATEMCVRRPLVIRAKDWEHRFDIGQYAWFLAHDNYRRYEIPVPEKCMEKDGRLCLQLSVPEPENAPYIREIRLEVEE